MGYNADHYHPGGESDNWNNFIHCANEMPLRDMFEQKKYYHIYNRGLYKQTLFHNEEDFKRFSIYMDRYIKKCSQEFDILAYCLLPNHFHFVFFNKTQWYKISYFIWNICASYIRYYQNKYHIDRGKLYFESRFKCKEIDDQEYLQQCLHYVENNPVKHGIVDTILDRQFRSDCYCHPGAQLLDCDLSAHLEE